MHLNEIDAEATICLDVLMDITSIDAKILFPFFDKIIVIFLC